MYDIDMAYEDRFEIDYEPDQGHEPQDQDNEDQDNEPQDQDNEPEGFTYCNE